MEINEIHKMGIRDLKAESRRLAGTLKGHLTINKRTHQTSRKRLIDKYLEIRTAK